MNKSMRVLIALAAITMLTNAFAQEPGRTVTPASTALRTPGKPHTSIYMFVPDKGVIPLTIPNGETPATVACIYGLTTHTAGCPKSSTLVPVGGAKAVAVVEYGVYSAMQADFNTFNTQFGLPAATITTICSPAPPCPSNVGSGWDLETALDVQYAHAMAPNAQIIVSAFSDDPIGDGAETAAANAVAAAGGGEVSNSWTYNGGENWCGSGNCELQYDSYFVK
jgi:subtilase family serine protease